MKRVLLALAVLLAPGVAGRAQAATSDEPLIVISIDGFRAEYSDRHLTPTLAALAADGAHAKAMHPSFPSVTSPNHYTLMTGLRPDHHGIVDNGFIDPAIPGERFGEDSKDSADPRFWNEATPLWVTAANAGLRTAESHWPGGKVRVKNTDFTYHDTSPDRTPPDAQTATVLNWVDLPANKRPQLILLHYDPVDAMGHLFGPDSPQVNAAIGQVDAAIGKLVDGLQTRGVYQRTNIVIVSDHGMTDLTANPPGYVLDTLLNLDNVTVSIEGADAGIWPKPGHEAEVEKALIATPHPHMTCWHKKDIPANLHYGTNPRVPPILCLGDLGWSIVTQATLNKYSGHLRGNHGYDPAFPDMWAVFFAHGPAFKHGVTLEPFDNVDVYPLLAKLLDVRPQANDGNLADTAAALK
jgi:predicted AlkP superfamily pyrophosphatase or phosphodiesterase